MEDGFVDQYPACENAGIGTGYSCRYSKKRTAIQSHEFLSCSTAISNSNKVQLYAIFSGFNGGDNTAKFVMNRIVYEIFQDNPITMAMRPKEIEKQLKHKFENVAQRYLELHSEALDKRLMAKLDESETSKDAISEIDQKIRQGTTALVVLKMNEDLYIINCGCSMALAVLDNKGAAVQLNQNLHENDNQDETIRLESMGIDPTTVLKPTRAIGDLHRTHLYEENPDFKSAKGAPVISTPDVKHIAIDEKWKYLVLLSDGVVQNLKEMEIDDIPMEVSVRLAEDNTATSTAQALVDVFSRKHYDSYSRTQDEQLCSGSSQREEMTIIFVKLTSSTSNLYETVDSAISTLDSTEQSLNDTQPKCYIDASHVSTTPTFQEMNKMILKP